jgi:hypothetical protein
VAIVSGNEVGHGAGLRVGHAPGLRVEHDGLPESRPLTEPGDILAARRLQAAEYVRAGYVAESALAADGTLRAVADPWAPHAVYFGAFDEEGAVRATSRVLPNDAGLRLPTLQLPTIDPAVRRRLEQVRPGRLGEISALARQRDAGAEYPRAVFRQMWRFALEHGVETYVLCVDALVLRTLRAMDHHLFRVAGPASPAPVRPVFPVWADVADVRDEIFTHGLRPAAVTLP